jgi:hypothetical protein
MHSLGLDLGPEFLDSLQFLGILLVRLKEAFDGDLELRICVAYDERVRMIEFRLLDHEKEFGLGIRDIQAGGIEPDLLASPVG